MLENEIENKDPITKKKIVILKNEDQMLNKKNNGENIHWFKGKIERKTNISKRIKTKTWNQKNNNQTWN